MGLVLGERASDMSRGHGTPSSWGLGSSRRWSLGRAQDRPLFLLRDIAFLHLMKYACFRVSECLGGMKVVLSAYVVQRQSTVGMMFMSDFVILALGLLLTAIVYPSTSPCPWLPAFFSSLLLDFSFSF
jgi:hypothetical protein